MSATKILLSATPVILVISAFIPHVVGIKCFQCNSFEDKGCDIIVPTNGTHSPFLKECDIDISEEKEIFCRKIVQHITAFEKEHTRIIRKCSYEKSEKDCYHFEDDDHSEVVCQCFSEGCNRGGRGATPGNPWSTVLSILVVTAVSFTATRL